jgi:hypothetical protein
LKVAFCLEIMPRLLRDFSDAQRADGINFSGWLMVYELLLKRRTTVSIIVVQVG